MSRVVYILKRIAKMDYSNMIKTCNYIHKKSNQNRVKIFFDMVNCGFKYGAGYLDYKLFHFYELNDAQRATFITRTISNRIVDLMNDPKYRHIMANKTDFNEYFAKYLGREWINMETATEEDFEAFAKKCPTIIVKPMAANCGQGVEKIDTTKENIKALYKRLKENQIGIAEEYVIQCEDMSKLYPNALNTVRVYTVLDENGKAHLIRAMLRIGAHGSIVDNINAGGLMTLVDSETGIVKNPATNKAEEVYDKHPDTGVAFVGFKIPFWKEAYAMCCEAAESIPQMKYIGWDVAFTDNGPIFIEGNHIPDHGLLQLHNLFEKEKVGMLPVLKKYVKGL